MLTHAIYFLDFGKDRGDRGIGREREEGVGE